MPGGLFTIDDDRLMFSAFKMAHTRSATHCSLALLGVGSSLPRPACPFGSLSVVILSDMVPLHECPCLLTMVSIDSNSLMNPYRNYRPAAVDEIPALAHKNNSSFPFNGNRAGLC